MKRQNTVKSFSEEKPKEKILRKTTILEAIERPFTTEPKTRRIRRGKTIVIRRCQEIMKHLWQTMHRKTATKKEIETAVFYCAGGDYRTIRKYVGFDIYKKGIFQKRIPGYLQRLRYIEKAGSGKYVLNHKAVPLSYHVEECFPPLPPSQLSVNGIDVSKDVLCVRNGFKVGYGEGYGEGALAPTNRQHNNNTQHTHKSVGSESKLENSIVQHSGKVKVNGDSHED